MMSHLVAHATRPVLNELPGLPCFGGGDANLYRYVGNSPLMFVDPLGLTAATASVPLVQNGMAVVTPIKGGIAGGVCAFVEAWYSSGGNPVVALQQMVIGAAVGAGLGLLLNGAPADMVLFAVVGLAITNAITDPTASLIGAICLAFETGVYSARKVFDKGLDLIKSVGKGSGDAPKGTIYRVPGKGTPSRKPYIGRHNKPNPAETRKSPDGRDRTQAEVIDTYDLTNELEGRIKEEQAILNEGLENLDNKRHEISPKKWPPEG